VSAEEEETEKSAIDADNVESAEVGAPSAKLVARFGRLKLVAYALLPIAVVAAGALAGFLKWESHQSREAEEAGVESVAAASETAKAMLSYHPDSVEKDLNSARDRMTGSFLDSYTKLINDMVIPGAKQKKITAVAEVPAAASMSASPSHAEVLVFINQAVTIGDDPPTNTASSVRVTLEKVKGRWLVSGFDPV
jgi:Mce-associated membrane protein